VIELKLNSDDELALRHMGNALTAMASEIKGVTGEELGTHGKPEGTESQMVEAIAKAVDDESVSSETFNEMLNDEYDDKLDSNGLPWDARIHSSSKAKIKDGSWKKRKGVDASTVATVEAELRALMAIPVETVKSVEETSYPLYWRHDGSDEVGIIRNDEEYEQIFSTKGGIIDLINEELFNELRLKNDTDEDYIDEPTPPAPEPIIPKPQGVTPPPPPPPVVNVVAGNTPDDVEAASFVEITRFITGTMVKEMGYTIPEVNKLLTDEYGVTFSTLKANEALFPQVLAFLKGQPKK